METELIVKSKVKEFLRENDMNTSEALFYEINKDVVRKLKKSCERASKNRRKTIGPQDY